MSDLYTVEADDGTRYVLACAARSRKGSFAFIGTDEQARVILAEESIAEIVRRVVKELRDGDQK